MQWVGAEDAENPASVTVVHPADVSEHDHGAKTTDTSNDNNKAGMEQASDEVTKTNESKTPLYLSIAALIVGLFSFGITFMKKR